MYLVYAWINDICVENSGRSPRLLHSRVCRFDTTHRREKAGKRLFCQPKNRINVNQGTSSFELNSLSVLHTTIRIKLSSSVTQRTAKSLSTVKASTPVSKIWPFSSPFSPLQDQLISPRFSTSTAAYARLMPTLSAIWRCITTTRWRMESFQGDTRCERWWKMCCTATSLGRALYRYTQWSVSVEWDILKSVKGGSVRAGYYNSPPGSQVSLSFWPVATQQEEY